MNKTLAIACLAILFASASAQSAGSFCTRNTDCNQTQSLCCAGFASNSTFSPYTQFNCVAHTNGTANIKTNTCLVNGTDYTSVCATEDKTCVNNATKFVSCGNSIAMLVIDTLNPSAVCTTSGAMTLATSAFFAVLAALALLF
jgi:hypothetical protein